MHYTILIYQSPAAFAARSNPEKLAAFLGSFAPYLKAFKDEGIYVTGAGLQTPDTATTVAHRGGQRFVQDGPYADTKEQLGGFIMIEVPTLDIALDWAARCPGGEDTVVEVRPNLPPME